MILFGSNKVKLTQDRKKPDEYDLLAWDASGAMFVSYKDHKIEPIYPSSWQYHVILYKRWYRLPKETKYHESFKACLLDPLVFIESIVGQGYYGYIGKCSDKSKVLFFNLMNQVMEKGHANEYLKSYISG